MSDGVSLNTQAALLLTAPLLAGRKGAARKKEGARGVELLQPREYQSLWLRLREVGAEPAQLLSREVAELLGACDLDSLRLDSERLERLLGRRFLLSQALEHWLAHAFWVVGRGDDEYPHKLTDKLGDKAPAILYGCGAKKILDRGGLAVVGSRHVDEALLKYTQEVGRLAARARLGLISGGARGIDQAAMHGALEEGGVVVGVLADSLEKKALNSDHRNMILEGKLTLLSLYDPNAGFHVGQAMQRNKFIYALADAALVVSTDLGKGGTWAGATEQLDKWRWAPLYVYVDGRRTPGIEALQKKGALPWPTLRELKSRDLLYSLLQAETPQARSASSERDLFGTS